VGALFALSKIRHRGVLEALPLALNHCEATDRQLRNTALRALGKMVQHQPSEAFTKEDRGHIHKALMIATHDSWPAVRAKAVRGLGKLAAADLLDAEQKPVTLGRLEEIVGRHEKYQWDAAFVVRREAEESLEKIR